MILLEFMGTLLICTTLLLTHGNPILVGLAHTTALYIGKGKVESHFSPFVVLLQYSLGRMTLEDSLLHLVVQSAAVLVLVLAYTF